MKSAGARQEVKDVLKKIDTTFEIFTPLMSELSLFYIQRGGLPKKCEQDANHIALATVLGDTKIVSWNFKHMVNFRRIEDISALNLEKGYKTINIYSPPQIISAYEN